MPPKLNPKVKIEMKEGAFALTDSDSGQTRPIDPLAVFVCSLCDGTREIPEIVSSLQQKLLSTGQSLPQNLNLQDQVQKIIDVLSQEGVLFIE